MVIPPVVVAKVYGQRPAGGRAYGPSFNLEALTPPKGGSLHANPVQVQEVSVLGWIACPQRPWDFILIDSGCVIFNDEGSAALVDVDLDNQLVTSSPLFEKLSISEVTAN